MLKNNITIFFILVSSIVYAQHYKEKVKRLGLENCEKCHTTNKWDEFKSKIKFNHKKTGFDLGKQHSKLECASCHTFKTNISEKKNCKSCHFDPHKKILKSPEKKKTDFVETHGRVSLQNKNRVSLQNKNRMSLQNKKSDNCESCHKETVWHKVEYKHEEFSKGFVLEGKHKDVTCIQCHKTQNYSDAKANCVSCHKTDYIKTTWPSHKFAKFNKDCVSCHTPYGWYQARYYKHETYFPILNGTHSGFTCRSCHTNNHDYSDSTCIDCHTHSKGKTDRQHQGVSTYTYTKKSCYSCHPRGRR